MTKSIRLLLVGSALAGFVSGTNTLARADLIQGHCGGTHGKADHDRDSADSGKKASKSKKDKHGCKGQNSCKGKGGCGSTKGKNDCKGQGECRTDGKPMEKEK